MSSSFLYGTSNALFGGLDCRLRQTRVPAALASFLLISLSFTLFRKSSRDLDGFTCSTRTLIRLAMILPFTLLFTITPSPHLVTLNTRPVRPWYAYTTYTALSLTCFLSPMPFTSHFCSHPS